MMNTIDEYNLIAQDMYLVSTPTAPILNVNCTKHKSKHKLPLICRRWDMLECDDGGDDDD
jgi:hypothetical protein